MRRLSRTVLEVAWSPPGRTRRISGYRILYRPRPDAAAAAGAADATGVADAAANAAANAAAPGEDVDHTWKVAEFQGPYTTAVEIRRMKPGAVYEVRVQVKTRGGGYGQLSDIVLSDS